MLAEQHPIGLEAPYDVLCDVETVDAHDRFAAGCLAQVPAEARELRRRHRLGQLVGVDGNAVRPDARPAPIYADAAFLDSDLVAENCLACRKEVSRRDDGLKDEAIV